MQITVLHLFDRLGKILITSILTLDRKVTMIPLTYVKSATRFGYVSDYCLWMLCPVVLRVVRIELHLFWIINDGGFIAVSKLELVFRQHRMHLMRPIFTDVHSVWKSVFTVQKWLNGSTCHLGWTLLGAHGTLCSTRVPIPPQRGNNRLLNFGTFLYRNGWSYRLEILGGGETQPERSTALC